MNRMKVLVLCGGLLAQAGFAQDTHPELDLSGLRVSPPELQLRGEPNPAYAQELEATIRRLDPAEKKDFFKELRRQQQALNQRIDELIFNYDKAVAFRKSIVHESSGLSARAEDLVDFQRKLILRLKEIQRTIDRVRQHDDPQRFDALDFKADFYAGLEFSSLYGDGTQDSSFFSTSKPFVTLDLRNTFRWPGQEKWLDFFGDLSFQSASKEDSSAVNIITTSGNFKGEMGLWWMQALTERVSWGALCSLGMLGYTQQTPTADLTTSTRDQFQSTWTVGFTLRQEEGSMRGSFAEVAYKKDPLFLHPNRILVRGQVVLTQFGSKGSNGDFYIEGLASKGSAGRDEAILLLGLRLSTVSFLQSLGAGN